MKNKTFAVTTLLTVFLLGASAHAVTQLVGDIDSFGWEDTVNRQFNINVPALIGSDGGSADKNSDGKLGQLDLLPDLSVPLTGGVLTGDDDDYDNRAAGEKTATNGAQFTDVTLSTSFNTSFPSNPDFPGLADVAFFQFNFTVPNPIDPDYGKDHYVSFVYGDYDVTPMDATVDGVDVTLPGNTNYPGTPKDGAIWATFTVVPWLQMLDGVVMVEIDAENEPYIVFDYAILDTDPIELLIPEPCTLLLLGSAIFGVLFKKFRK